MIRVLDLRRDRCPTKSLSEKSGIHLPHQSIQKPMALVLAAFVGNDHASWENHLPVALKPLNIAYQSTTEVTPYELVYGRSPTKIVEFMLP